MKHLVLVPFFIFLSSSYTNSQANLEWEAKYTGINPIGNDIGNVIAVDNDGFVYVAGKTAGLSNFDYITIKYNSSGDTIWTRTFNGSGNGDDEILAIEVDFQGNVYVTGSSMGVSTGLDIVTIKYDATGIMIWQNTHFDNFNENDYGKSIKVDAFNNVYICGSVRTTNNKPVIIKISSTGSTLWTINSSPFNDLDSAEQILFGTDGNILVSAVDFFSFNLQNTSYRILEINPNNGNVIRGYNSGIIRGFPIKFKTDSNGNIYVLSSAWWGIGYEVYWTKFVKGVTDAADYNGFVSSVLTEVIDFDLDGDNNFYILCKRFTNRNTHFIFRENFDNTMYWERFFNTSSSSDDVPISIHLSNNDIENPAIFVSGYSSLGKLTISKYSNSGDSLGTNFYSCNTNNANAVSDSYFDKCDNIYLTGYSSCDNSGQDIKTIKYSTAQLPSITASGTNPICIGSSITLSTPTCSGCTYLWSNGNTNNSISISPDINTEYTVTVKYPSACELTSLPYQVILSPIITPIVSVSASSLSICSGQSVVFSATTVNGGTNPSYTWYVNDVLQNENTASFSSSSLADGDVVSCTLTSNAKCLSNETASSNEITINVSPLSPTGVALTASANSICQGESIIFSALPSNAGTLPSFQWYVNGVLIPNQTQASFSTTLSQNSEIYVLLTSNAVCPSPSSVISDTLSIIVNPLLSPSISIIASTDTICEGETINFIATPSNGGNSPSYQWFVDDVLQATNTADFSGNNFDNLDEVSCILTSNAFCKSQTMATSNTITLTVNPSLTPSIQIISDFTSVCTGENISVSSSVMNEGDEPLYRWYLDSILQSENGNTFSTSNLLNGVNVFCVLLSNAECTIQQSVSSNTLSFTVHPLPIASITTDGPTTFCQDTSILLEATAASSYVWSNGETTQTVEISSSGSYIVTLTNENGCSGSTDITLIVHPLPLDTVALSGPVTFCEGGSVTITCTLGENYLWNTGDTSQSINVSTNGNYIVTITDANGCSAISIPTTVIVNPIPIAEIVSDGPTTFCIGDTITLSTIPAQSYAWSSGETSPSLDVVGSGNYTVTITDQNGCKSISPPITITVNPLLTPSVEIATSNNIICEGDIVTFTAMPVNGGPLPTYQWYINGILQTETGPSFATNALMNNQQTLCRLTSSETCLSQTTAQSKTISIAVNPLLTPEVSINTSVSSILSCQEVTFTPTSSNGGLDPTYQWFLNGNVISNATTFTTSDLINGDQISCMMTSTAICKSTPFAQSNIITMAVVPLPQPNVIITGDTIYSSNYDESQFTYGWYFNGNQVSTSPFIICNQFGNGSYYLVINYNGCTVTSNAMDIVCTVPTFDIANYNYFSLFPNPTRNLINISSNTITFGDFRVVVYDLLGQQLVEQYFFSLTENFSKQLDLSVYMNGIYTVAIYHNDQRQIFKVIKIE